MGRNGEYWRVVKEGEVWSYLKDLVSRMQLVTFEWSISMGNGGGREEGTWAGSSLSFLLWYGEMCIDRYWHIFIFFILNFLNQKENLLQSFIKIILCQYFFFNVLVTLAIYANLEANFLSDIELIFNKPQK